MDYTEVCKSVGELYLTLSSKLSQTMDQLSIAHSQNGALRAENEKLRQELASLSADAK